jgi:delta(3,5)-delta(2,4)-dienoyl-CoA isomerase
VSDLHALPQHTDPGRRALLTRAHLLSFQNAIGAPARIPQPVIAAVHGVAFGLALDLLSVVDVRWAASDAAFSIKEVDVGLAADTGTLARVPKLVGNASLLGELALSARTFGAEEARSSLGFVSRVVQGSREEVVRAAIVEFAEVVARKSPVAVVGTKRFITHALDHSCVFSFPFCCLGFFGEDELNWPATCVVWRKHLSIRRRGRRLLSRVR